MNDSKIALEIINKLRLDSELKSPNIIVLVKDGAVTLKGNILTNAEKYLAEQIARTARGVMNIINKLNVELNLLHQENEIIISKNTAATPISEVTILPVEEGAITAKNESLALISEVEECYQKKEDVSFIKILYGIFNSIRIKPAQIVVCPDALEKQIMQEFQRNPSLDAKAIYVIVDGSKVTLKGIVHSFAEKKEAQGLAWSVNGVTEVNDELLLNYIERPLHCSAAKF